MQEQKEKAERTTMTISITIEDKRTLKQEALDRGITVSALIHEWIKRGMR